MVRSPRTRTKPGSPPLYEHVGRPALSAEGEEEHVSSLDEVAIAGADRLLDQQGVEPVRKRGGAEALLQLPVTVLKGIGHQRLLTSF